MREYKDQERVVRKVCVKVVCDMCKREAESPEQESMAFEWGTVGLSGGIITSIFDIDGEYNSTSLDLCYDCAEWLINEISRGKLRRPGT